MTLNLPLLYVLWLEEYCQVSPNKNKSPNLWHVTSNLVCCIFGCTSLILVYNSDQTQVKCLLSQQHMLLYQKVTQSKCYFIWCILDLTERCKFISKCHPDVLSVFAVLVWTHSNLYNSHISFHDFMTYFNSSLLITQNFSYIDWSQV